MNKEYYNGYELRTNPAANTGSCLVYLGEDLVKCFASDETAGGVCSVDKAKNWIDGGCQPSGITICK